MKILKIDIFIKIEIQVKKLLKKLKYNIKRMILIKMINKLKKLFLILKDNELILLII